MLTKRMLGPSIVMEEGRRVIEAMLEAAMKEPERHEAFAVVDTSGALVYFVRMDGGSALNSRVAINKAYTCIYTRWDTAKLENLLKKTGYDIVNFGDPRLVAIAGGALLRSKDGSIVGAIGTSGRPAMGPMGDEELAQIGVKAYLNL